MKGFLDVLAFVFLLAIAVSAMYTYGVAVGVNEGVVKKIVIEKDVYLLGNALDYGKLFLETSLKYSTYQALFDYGEKEADIKDFQKEISEKIRENLNKYTEKKISFIDENHKIDLPKYNKIDVSFENGTLKIKASGSKIQISQARPTEKIELAKDGNLNFEMEYVLFDLVSRFVSEKLLENKLNEKIKEFQIFGEKKIEGCENKEKEISDIDVFNFVQNTSFSSIEEAQENILFQLIEEARKTAGAQSTNRASVEISLLSNSSRLVPSCETKKENKCESQTKSYSYTKSCTFSYNYTLNTSISFTDLQKKFPVAGQLLDKRAKQESLRLKISQVLAISN